MKDCYIFFLEWTENLKGIFQILDFHWHIWTFPTRSPNRNRSFFAPMTGKKSMLEWPNDPKKLFSVTIPDLYLSENPS